MSDYSARERDGRKLTKGGFAHASLPVRGTFDRRLKSTQKRL